MKALIDARHAVRMMVRAPERIRPALTPLGVEAPDHVVGDVTDPAAVRRALDGCDAVLHSANVYSLHGRVGEMAATNPRSTVLVLGTARELGLDPIVHVSSYVALLPPSGSGPLHADSPLGQPAGPYARSKVASERIARRLQDEGAPVVIMRPGAVWGPHDPHLGESAQIARAVLRGQMPVSLPGPMAIVDVRDVAATHAAVMEAGRGPRRYLVVAEDVPFAQIIAAVRRATGRRIPAVPLPERPLRRALGRRTSVPGRWRALGSRCSRPAATRPRPRRPSASACVPRRTPPGTPSAGSTPAGTSPPGRPAGWPDAQAGRRRTSRRPALDDDSWTFGPAGPVAEARHTGLTRERRAIMPLIDVLPREPDVDAVYEAFTSWAEEQGLELYPHQEEAAIELFSGANVILATPTGSGKSLVAIAAHFAAMADRRVSFYTAPIKALVSEKFFALCAIFGAENVGMLTGDASVNSDAPIICCTAEVLANIALREGADADVGQVVMDEFHFYADPQRGWAWQVPLLSLPHAQFLLMSATLGDVAELQADLTRRTGRETALVDTAERPVPLDFRWSVEPLHELLEDLVRTDRAPIYVVHFTQAAALERAQALLSAKLCTKEERLAIADAIGAFRFTAGFGRTLSKLVRSGIGVHHAGMLPRYRRLVEQLAQTGLLKVVCGTDTLGVGINVPIRTVVFTGLAKFDGTRSRLLKSREFHQIAGRAGRPGFDTSGWVVVQAPEHAIENARLVAKAGDDPKKLRRIQRSKPAEGAVSWNEETFARLRDATPEALVSRMRVNHAMILNVINQPADPAETLRALMEDNHEDERGRARLVEQASSLREELLLSGVLEALAAPDGDGRTLRLAPALQEDFALNQPLASFALVAFELIDPESENYALDVLSVVEAILDDPSPVLRAQENQARGEAVAEMKADGIEYEERMERLEAITYPKPLAEPLEQALRLYRETHPWVLESDLSPKSIVRDMYASGRTFTEFVAHYGVARSEGLVLRYLSDTYRALRQTVPEQVKNDELDDIVEWLGETVRQIDSSLLDEWEALTDPESVARAAAAVAAGEALAPPRPITANERAFGVMIRNSMFHRVQLAASDRFAELGQLDAAAAAASELPGRVVMNAAAWEAALGAYWDEYASMDAGPAARAPELLMIDRSPARDGARTWTVRQILSDPEGHHDWAIVATVDLDASDAAGEPVIRTESCRSAAG